MTFKEKLVKLRKMKGLTQDEFASAVGVSRQAVYKWESGQSYPEVAKLIEIKMLLGISIDDLLDESYEVIVPEKKKRRRLSKQAQAEIEQEVLREISEQEEETAAVVAEEPQFKRITISGGSIAVAKENFGNQQASDKYTFNEATGEITSFLPYSDSPTRNKVSGWVRAIHVGNWGGAVSKIIYFLASMLGASLPLTGYYLWFKRLYGKSKRKVLKKETT